MRKILFLLLLVSIVSCGYAQNETYTDAEQQTLENINKWFSDNDADWNELKSHFEGYFQNGQITKKGMPIEEQYFNILTYFERPTGRFPTFTSKKKVVDIRKKLNISKKDIVAKKHLMCFNDMYSKLKNEKDTISSYYVFGATIETSIQIPNISPGLIAGAIKAQAHKSDLKKELYQKAIILLFVFDMTLFLND